jgi:hypothetical protein
MSNENSRLYSISKRDNDLVKVPCRGHFGVLLPQLDCQYRITLQADAPAIFRQVEQCKHFPDHFKDQGCIVEWESFDDARFGQAIVAYLFDIQLFFQFLLLNVFPAADHGGGNPPSFYPVMIENEVDVEH